MNITPERKKELRKLFDKQVKQLAKKHHLSEQEVILLLRDQRENPLSENNQKEQN